MRGSGAGVADSHSPPKWTPLCYAIEKKNLEIIDLLLERGAYIDADCMRLAAGNQRIVDLLN